MVILIALNMFILNTFAKPFANDFIEFDLPDSWSCAPYADVWTCKPLEPSKQKDIIVVMSFAAQGQKDSMEYYLDYFSNSIVSRITEKNSEPKYTKYKEILGQNWVDSLHENSEVRDFYTRYLSTIKSGRAILLSITVDKNKYNPYMNELYRMVEGMKLRMTMPAAAPTTGIVGLLGDRIRDLGVKKTTEVVKPVEIEKLKEEKSWLVPAIIALVVFIAVFVILKIRKRRRNPKELI